METGVVTPPSRYSQSLALPLFVPCRIGPSGNQFRQIAAGNSTPLVAPAATRPSAAIDRAQWMSRKEHSHEQSYSSHFGGRHG